MELTDAVLLEQWAAKHEADAFAEIVARHSGMVYGTCRRIVGDATVAEDLAQECFIKLAAMKGQISRSLGGWLHRVATHRSLDYLRTEKRRRAREKAAQNTPVANFDPAWQEIEQLVDQAVNELPDELKDAVVLHYFEGQTHAAIAETLDITRSGVTRRIQRGTGQIQTTLEQRGVRSAVVSGLAGLLIHHASEAAPSTLLKRLGTCALVGKGALPVAARALSSARWAGVAVCLTMLLGAVLVLWPDRRVETVASEVAASAVSETVPPAPADTLQADVTEEATPKPATDPGPSLPSETASEQLLRCVDRQGNPVSGAEVRFTYFRLNMSPMVYFFGEEAYHFENVGPELTNQDGFVSVPAFTQISAPKAGLPPGLLIAYARIPDKLVGVCRVLGDDLVMVESMTLEGLISVPSGFNTMNVEIQMLSLASMEGKVNAGVSLPASHDKKVFWPKLFSVRPDAYGRFALHDLPKSGTICFAATAAGLAETQFYSLDPASLGVVTLDMPLEGIIEGSLILSTTGQPAAGYTVFARRRLGGQTHPYIAEVECDGSFRLDGLPTGEYRVTVAPRTRPRQYVASVCTPVYVEAGFVTDGLTLWLEPGCLVTGTVKNGHLGTPIPNVQVVALNPGSGGEAIGSCESDPMGHFSLRVPTGTTELYLGAIPSIYETPKQQARQNVDVLPGVTQMNGVDFELVPSQTPSPREVEEAIVMGRILDSEGNPVAGGIVMQEWEYPDGENMNFFGTIRLGHTDEDGQYAVAIEALGRHRLTVGAIGYTAARSEWIVLEPEEKKTMPDLIISPATAWVEGLLLTPEGQPISDATVSVDSMTSFRLEHFLQIGANGRFRVEHLANETIDVRVTRPGYELARFSVQPNASYEFTLTPLATEEEDSTPNSE